MLELFVRDSKHLICNPSVRFAPKRISMTMEESIVGPWHDCYILLFSLEYNRFRKICYTSRVHDVFGSTGILIFVPIFSVLISLRNLVERVETSDLMYSGQS